MTALAHPVEELLRAAAEWRLIGLLLECPSAQWRVRVNELAHEVADADLSDAVVQAGEHASEGLYHSTFAHLPMYGYSAVPWSSNTPREFEPERALV